MNKPSLLIIFLTVFIDLIGFGIVMPLLPRYTEQFGARGYQIGLVISSFSLMQFFFAPWWGRLSDRIGRRPVLLISNAGSTLSYALFAIASSMQGVEGLAVLLVSRVFAGICGANISVASAYIADITTPENRSKGMGLIGMAFGLGFILGPAIGSLAAWWGMAGPGWAAVAFCAFNFTLGCFILTESRKPGAAPAAPRPKLAQWRHTLSHPVLAVLILLFFLATFCFTCFETTLPLLLGSARIQPHNLTNAEALVASLRDGQDPASRHLRELAGSQQLKLPTHGSQRGELSEVLNRLLEAPGFRNPAAFPSMLAGETLPAAAPATSLPAPSLFHSNRMLLQAAYPEALSPPRFHFDERRIGFLFAYCGLLAAMVQGGAIGRLVKRFGEQRLIGVSLLVVAVSLLMIPLAGGMGSLLAGLGLFAVGSGITRAPTMGLLSSLSPADEQGATLGVAQSFGALARILGPMVATTLYGTAVALPYFVCAGIALAAACIAFLRLRVPS